MIFQDKIPADFNIPIQISRKDNSKELIVVVNNFKDNTIPELKKYNPTTIDVFDMSLEDIFIAYVGGNI